jgi:hypothetical protein
MGYEAIVYKVMIASPSDVISERALIRDMLAEWNIVNSESGRKVLLPVGWETHASPAMGDRPQSIINKQVLQGCDLLVGVFWTRLGTPTGEYASGSVEEIEEHIKAGKPVMLYFSDVPIIPSSVDAAQYDELLRFKEACESRGIFETYTSLDDFAKKFYRQLQLKINQDKYFKLEEVTTDVAKLDLVESGRPEIPQLSREAQVLLKEASRDPSGHIVRLVTLGGFFVQTNSRQMTEGRNPQDRAIWEATIEELEDAGLIEDRAGKRQIFLVTRKGYELAELLNP